MRVFLSIKLFRKRTALFNLILVGSLLAMVGCLLLICSLAFNWIIIDGQIFLDFGLVTNIFLLNIGLIYKFNHLKNKQVEDQNKLIQSLEEKRGISCKIVKCSRKDIC